MGSALIPVYPGRLSVLQKYGPAAYLAVHAYDLAYLRKKQEFKRRFLQRHPDIGTYKGFARLRLDRARWYQKARVYYWRLDRLMPPDWSAAPVAPSGWRDLKLSRRREPAPVNDAHTASCAYWRPFPATGPRWRICSCAVRHPKRKAA